MELKFDHAYTADPVHLIHSKMRELGFNPLPQEVEHPGGLFCRFIAFREFESDVPVYLEFADARDWTNPVRCPGLSLRSLGNLEEHARHLAASGIDVEFNHKNYEWKTDNISRLPGWNFVSFKHLGFSSLYPWITEYEPRPNGSTQNERIPVQNHPNGVKRIKALELTVNNAGTIFFEKLLGQSLDAPIEVPGGQTLYFSVSETTKLRSIVLEASDLSRLRPYSSDGESDWRGQKATVIRLPSMMWDLIIAEEAK